MRRVIKTSIDIQAPPEVVWGVLMDFDRYPEWSAHLLSIEGRAIPGSYLQITEAAANGGPRIFKTAVLQVTPPRTFRWLEHLGIPGLFDRERSFVLEYQFGGHTRLRQSEECGGLLTLFAWRWFEPPAVQEFAAFNQALKIRAESRR